MSNEQPSPGDRVRQALAGHARWKSYSPKFAAYLASLNAMQFHTVLYLLTRVKISSSSIPKLWPVSEPEGFEKMLTMELNELVRMNGDEPGRH